LSKALTELAGFRFGVGSDQMAKFQAAKVNVNRNSRKACRSLNELTDFCLTEDLF
jgi:hypothetical protein